MGLSPWGSSALAPPRPLAAAWALSLRGGQAHRAHLPGSHLGPASYQNLPRGVSGRDPWGGTRPGAGWQAQPSSGAQLETSLSCELRASSSAGGGGVPRRGAGSGVAGGGPGGTPTGSPPLPSRVRVEASVGLRMGRLPPAVTASQLSVHLAGDGGGWGGGTRSSLSQGRCPQVPAGTWTTLTGRGGLAVQAAGRCCPGWGPAPRAVGGVGLMRAPLPDGTLVQAGGQSRRWARSPPEWVWRGAGVPDGPGGGGGQQANMRAGGGGGGGCLVLTGGGR